MGIRSLEFGVGMKTQEETARLRRIFDRRQAGSSLPYELSSLVSDGSLSSLRTDFERVMRMTPTTIMSMEATMKIVPKYMIFP